MDTVFPEMPRIITAIAEFVACVYYTSFMKKRFGRSLTIVILMVTGILLLLTNRIGERVGVLMWMPFMFLGLLIMYLCLLLSCKVSIVDAGYFWTRAFISAELTASLQWEIYYYTMRYYNRNNHVFATSMSILIFLIFYAIVYRLEKKYYVSSIMVGITKREMRNSILTAFAVFLFSNLSFAFKDTTYAASLGVGMLTVRTLADFSGFLMLFAQFEQRAETIMQHELETTKVLFQKQYEHYQNYKENDEILNRKYHDLKHQIEVIRMETDPAKREEYMYDLDYVMRVQESKHKTGNSVLDTILSGKSMLCVDKKIHLMSYADAKDMGFIDVMSICNIFGNALDNAIECVEQINDDEKRQIRIYVYNKNGFLMIRIENCYEANIKFNHGIPQTTKSNTDFHGFGIKSIRNSVEKYDGNLSVTTDDGWFKLIILIPIPRDSEGSSI